MAQQLNFKVKKGLDVTTDATIGANLAVTSHATVNSSLTVNNGMYVDPSTTVIYSPNTTFQAPSIKLNAGVSGAPTANSELEFKRGTANSVVLRWNEAADVFEITNTSRVASQIHAGGVGAANVAINNADGTVLQDLTVSMDAFGHVTAISTASANLDIRYDARYLGFSTLAVSGQTNIVADAYNDTLTLAGSGGITITTNSASDTITFSAPVIPAGNATTAGVLKVVNSVSNTDALSAGAAAAVKTAYDTAISAYSNATAYAATQASAAYSNAISASVSRSTNRTNWKTTTAANTEFLVAGQMGWSKFGNNHTIFDASSTLTPTNTVTDDTNTSNAWAPGYPVLMGWNGTATHGVRVDSSRISNTAMAGAYASFFTAAAASDGESTIGTVVSGQANAYLFNNSTSWGLFSSAGGALLQYERSTGKKFFAGIDSLALARKDTTDAQYFNGAVVTNGALHSTYSWNNAQGSLFFGNTGQRYLMYDGANYVFNGASVITNKIQATPSDASVAGVLTGGWFVYGKTLQLRTLGDGSQSGPQIHFFKQANVEWGLGIQPGSGNSMSMYINGSDSTFGTEVFRLTTAGNLTVTGDLTAFGSMSDRSLKENIVPLGSTLSQVSKLSGYRFNYIGSDEPLIGVIAQEVEQEFPELVYTTPTMIGDEPKKAVRYELLTAVLLEAIKDLKQEVEQLKAKINS